MVALPLLLVLQARAVNWLFVKCVLNLTGFNCAFVLIRKGVQRA